MADAFTPNLNLNKPENGYSVDTWGQKINADLDKIDLFAGETNTRVKGLEDGTTALIDDALPAIQAEIVELQEVIATLVASAARLAVPVGSVASYAGQTLPAGWLPCDGREVDRSKYATLFSMIGGTFGWGNQLTTFNLPDARGRALIGASAMFGGASANVIPDGMLGWRGGAAFHTLTVNETPPHNHAGTTDAQGDHSHQGGSFAPESNFGGGTLVGNYGLGAGGIPSYRGANTSVAGRHAHNVTTGWVGGGAAHNNIQPSIAFNAIIYTGVFD